MLGLVACGRIGFDPIADDATQIIANRAFATSSLQVPGQLGGIARADAVCAARASEAGLGGQFVAWVSSSTVDAIDRVAGARGWVRIDGLPIADMPDELAMGELLHPIRTDEYGRDLGTEPDFYGATGTFDGRLNSNCNDFTVTNELVLGGYPFLAGGNWSSSNTVPCADPARLYCFQIDLAVPLTFARASGRYAFVSVGEFAPSSGVASADAICAAEAAGAGLTGTFRALLMTTQPAAARFDVTGRPWVRTDGIALADTATAFMLGTTRAPLNVTASGTISNTSVVIGANSWQTMFDLPDPIRTCDSWSNANGSNALGLAQATGLPMLFNTTADCMQPYPVFCLES